MLDENDGAAKCLKPYTFYKCVQPSDKKGYLYNKTDAATMHSKPYTCIIICVQSSWRNKPSEAVNACNHVLDEYDDAFICSK